MTKVANQNLELEAKLGNAVKTVKKNYSSSVKGKFAIGKVLYETKPSDNSSDEEKEAYSDIFSKLPFGETVGDKFIRIYNTDYLRELSESPAVVNLPEGYNTLYSLTNKDIVGSPTEAFLVEGFTKGEFDLGGDNKFPATEVSSAKVTEITNFVKDIKKEVSEFDTSLVTIKVDSSVYSNDVGKVADLESLLGQLKDLVVEKIEGSEIKVSENNIKKLVKSATEFETKRVTDAINKKRSTPVLVGSVAA